ncbi:MAG: DUF3524 domain-containing protein [Gammaproteobacteria bacterium]|jgi:glycosyltransferase involved in cell wall biosynthesis|nr:DUF3524 domain-containing protein [Gammaproteobacteria bacterium]MBT3860055.1 DUF3524 domain-containing protein [Gammaproteobacteria bacterium]MBT3986995.1 DUF3524 domain-containing protein [Gammaproteobacteria bacterium]MBT4255690.1 DUF3524 domain-containing protein [Gammaproteobacteria bacterium]MBT4580740.1 DUF3524 domain-containing protein [Gammaproteobacteria bacterium]
MRTDKKRILLLSAYDAASHRAWRTRLEKLLPEYQWTQLVLAPRNFNWKIRGNSLIWAHKEAETLKQNYDLLIATSMVDLSSLRGFLPELAHIPSIVYFHENQFLYPMAQQRVENIEHQLVPLYSALCCDEIVFNSRFNQESFLEGARSLIKKLPDKLPKSILEKLESSKVIGVPLSLETNPRECLTKENAIKPAATGKPVLELLWNHRWEYDKGPGLLLEVIKMITDQSLPIKIHIVGEGFREQPVEFSEISILLRQHEQKLGLSAAEFGFVDDVGKYQTLQGSCDVVLSTALHDFQGLAIQEACTMGCTPLTPNDLVYPEYLDEKFLYQRGDNDRASALEIVKRLRLWLDIINSNGKLPKAELEDYEQESLRQRYQSLIENMIAANDRNSGI